MGFFASLFGLEKQKQDELFDKVFDEINLMDAVQAHVDWKTRLENVLNGTSAEKLDPDVVCRDDQCKLGKWIHGTAMQHFGDNESFRTLMSDHANFHYVAGQILRHVGEGDKAAADALLHGEYHRISHKVVMLLTQLNDELKAAKD